MSFDFSNINPIKKAQAAYKDGSGMGGGGMYFQQGRKRKQDDDIFEHSDENKSEELDFDGELSEEEIPQDTFVNKFVNWFRLKKK